MANRHATPDLNTVLEAYSRLEVEAVASPSEIRTAYRALAHAHHPDRLPGGSAPADREKATRRMAELNAAYALIRDAPLRHHSIGRGQIVDWNDAQSELDRTIARARSWRRWEAIIGVAALTLLAAVTLGPVLLRLGFGYATVVAIILGLVACMWMARRSVDAMSALDGVLALIRILGVR